MSPRSDGYCVNCDKELERLYWSCYECDYNFCSTYCIQEMLHEHEFECEGEIRQIKRKKMEKIDIPCRYFLSGYCKNGANCEFLHKKKQVPCDFFANGECKFGAKCVFLHDDSYVNKLKKAPKTTPPRMMKENIKEKNNERPICTHFQKGMCNYGDQCYKLHVKPTTSLNNNAKNISKVFASNNNIHNTKANNQAPVKNIQKSTMKPTVKPTIVKNTVDNTNNKPVNNKVGNVNNIPANINAYVPSNTFNFELAMEDNDEIFLSDSCDEFDDDILTTPSPSASGEGRGPPLAQYNRSPLQTFPDPPPRMLHNNNNVGPRLQKQFNTSPPNLEKSQTIQVNSKENVKSKKTKENQKPKKQAKAPKGGNIFSLLQGAEDSSGEADTEDDDSSRPMSADPQLSSSSQATTPQPPVQLTKKQKKKLEKEQKIEDMKIIVDNLRREGNRVFQEGNVNKAVDLYSKAIFKAGPNNPCYKLYNNRSAAFLKLKDYRNAHRDASKCLELNNDNIKALRRIVHCCIQLGQVVEGRERLKNLIAVDKDWKADNEDNPVTHEKKFKDIEHFNKEALRFFAKNSYEQAEDKVDKMLKIAGSCSLFYMMKATFAALLTRIEDARKILDKADSKDPTLKSCWYYFAQGLVYYHDNDLTRAISQFSQAMKEIKKAEVWHYQASQLHTNVHLGKKCVSEGQYEEALEIMEGSISLAKDNPKLRIAVFLERSNVYVKMKNYDRAHAEIKKAMQINSKLPKLHIENGKVFKAQKEYENACKEFTEAKNLEPDRAERKKIDALIEETKREKEKREREKKWEEDMKERRRKREEEDREKRRRQEEKREAVLKNSHYSVLGVSRTADQREIKQEFYKKAKMVHPDKHAAATPKEREKMEEKMKEITRAYNILSDRNKRDQYDRKLMALENEDSDDSDYDDDDDYWDEDDITVELFFRFVAQMFAR